MTGVKTFYTVRYNSTDDDNSCATVSDSFFMQVTRDKKSGLSPNSCNYSKLF